MKIEDYFKYYIQGSDHHLIPKDEFKELFNEMSNWREEAKELKKQLEEANEKIILLQASEPMLNYKKALEENQQKEFIKYLENGIDICDGFLDTVKSDLRNTPYRVMSSKKTNITNRIKENEIAHKVYKEILQKYKSIIGDINDKK